MATRRQNTIRPLLDKWGPEIETAFLASIDDVKRGVDYRRIVRALRQGNLDDAVAALHVDDAAFSSFSNALNQAFISGGQYATDELPELTDISGNRMVVRFDARSENAEDWISTYSSERIREISDDQRQMARLALQDGLERGDNPETVALDLVGRIDKSTGVRTGGFIGLTTRQEGSINLARGELTSGEEDQLRNYLGRALRDKRYDKYVTDALSGKKSLTSDIINRAITSLKNRTLAYRGKMIGRTEALTALHSGQRTLYEQLIATGQVNKEDIERTWDSTGDNKVRETHQELDGQTIAFDAYYVVPSTGDRLLYPGDPDAAAEERINCRCWEAYKINFARRLKAIKGT